MKWKPKLEARYQFAEYCFDETLNLTDYYDNNEEYHDAACCEGSPPGPCVVDLSVPAAKHCNKQQKKQRRRKTQSMSIKIHREDNKNKQSGGLDRSALLSKVSSSPKNTLKRSKTEQNLRQVSSKKKHDERNLCDDDDLDHRRKGFPTPGQQLAPNFIQRFLPSPTIPSVLGPFPRASMIVVSDRIRMAVLLQWSCVCDGSNQSVHSKINVAPILDEFALLDVDETAALGKETLTDRSNERARFVRKIVACFHQAVSQKVQTMLHPVKAPSPYLHYYKLSTFVSSLENVWIDELERIAVAVLGDSVIKRHSNSPWSVLEQSIKVMNVNSFATMSYFDVFQLWRTTQLTNRMFSEQHSAMAERPTIGTTCMVCLEKFPSSSSENPIFQLLSCGHATTCCDCWVSYFSAATKSGECSVQCTSHKCGTKLSFLDAAHLLGESQTRAQDNTHLLDKLVKLELKRYALYDRNGRHCPSPNCQRYVVPYVPMKDDMPPSRTSHKNLWFCPCGLSLCEKCPTNAFIGAGGASSSHPGLSCEAFAKVQNALNKNKYEQAMDTVQWVLRNTRACPKCRYPIDKAGGCNHIRCQRCQNYFCWHCGGEGQLCNAYFCTKAKQYWLEVNHFYKPEGHTELIAAVDSSRMYRTAQLDLDYLRAYYFQKKSQEKQNMECGSIKDDIYKLYLQLQQIMVWVQTSVLAFTSPDTNKLCKDAKRGDWQQKSTIKRDEDLRAIERQLRMATVAVKHRLSTLVDNERSTNQTQRVKAVSKRKLQSRAIIAEKRSKKASLRQDAIIVQGNELAELAENEALKNFCNMNDTEFLRQLRKTIKTSVVRLTTYQYASRK